MQIIEKLCNRCDVANHWPIEAERLKKAEKLICLSCMCPLCSMILKTALWLCSPVKKLLVGLYHLSNLALLMSDTVHTVVETG
ncbi:hypothetical protein FKM82_008205 [Ascaphus truei]